jgi:hypothetical protein
MILTANGACNLSINSHFGSGASGIGLSLTILGPLILPANLLLLLRGEVIGDVECLSDLLRGLALDHVGDGLAANIQKGLDVEVVRRL